jgi:L-threonylcarbamoyladenylate synthase
MVEILSIDREHPEPACLEQARLVLAGGGLVIVPTETVYGIACDPAVPGAMDNLLAAKGRDAGKPVARLAADAGQAVAAALGWNAGLTALAKRYWPGPLTMVLQTADGWTGFRVPDHEAARALARTCGRLLALTSANLSGEPDTKTAEEALQTVRADDGDRIECLREGAVPFEEIEQVFRGRGSGKPQDGP